MQQVNPRGVCGEISYATIDRSPRILVVNWIIAENKLHFRLRLTREQ